MSEAGEDRQSAAARRRRRRRRGGSGAGGSARTSQGATAAPSGAAGSGAAGSGAAGSGQSSARGARGRTGGTGGTSRSGASQGRSGSQPSRGRPPAGARAATASSDGDRGAHRAIESASGSDSHHAHHLADEQNEERRRANGSRLRALVLGAAGAPALVLGVVVGVAAGIVAGAVVSAAVFLALVYLLSTGAVRFTLRLVGGRPVADGELPALVNQVEGLCATIGVAQPELYLVDEPVANACALAGPRGRALLVVTSGLLSRLGLIELEGVLAHELVHLKRRDAAVSAVAVSTAGVVAWATGRDGLVHLAVGRGREYGADQAAALAVRYPPGLHDALAAMTVAADEGSGLRAGSVFSGRRWAATRWIWIDPMLGGPPPPAVGELDDTAVRVEALAQW